jgi:hypothetical protein
MPNPLTDELSGEAKAWLMHKFAELRCQFQPLDVERQRLHNRTWSLYR